MKKWLIEKLGGVSKKDHEEVIQDAKRFKNKATDYGQRILDGLKEKAEMEEAGKAMSERISELVDKLNEERKVSNGLMAKGTESGLFRKTSSNCTFVWLSSLSFLPIRFVALEP